MNSALAISALCTPAKLDVGTATLLSASGACSARTGTECRTSLCRRTDDENIKHCIHCYFRNAVLAFVQRRRARRYPFELLHFIFDRIDKKTICLNDYNSTDTKKLRGCCRKKCDSPFMPRENLRIWFNLNTKIEKIM